MKREVVYNRTRKLKKIEQIVNFPSPKQGISEQRKFLVKSLGEFSDKIILSKLKICLSDSSWGVFPLLLPSTSASEQSGKLKGWIKGRGSLSSMA